MLFYICLTGYNVYVETPYTHLPSVMEALNLDAESLEDCKGGNVVELFWQLCMDSCHTLLMLQYPPHVLSCILMQIAYEYKEQDLNEDILIKHSELEAEEFKDVMKDILNQLKDIYDDDVEF